MYNVFWEGAFLAEFETLKEAQEYIKADIKGTAETYGLTQKWVKNHFSWKIKKED